MLHTAENSERNICFRARIIGFAEIISKFSGLGNIRKAINLKHCDEYEYRAL